MIEVKIRMRDLQPGDVFKGVSNDPHTEFTVLGLDWDQTMICATPDDVYCSGGDAEFTLVATERDVTERVLAALDRFPVEVRQAVGRHYCGVA